MARFVMANRRAGKFLEDSKKASRAGVDLAARRMAGDIAVLNDLAPADPTARRVVVFEAEPAMVRTHMAELPADVLVEPEILHFRSATYLREHLSLHRIAPASVGLLGAGTTFLLRIVGSGQPIANAVVILFLRSHGGTTSKVKTMTDQQGRATFHFSATWQVGAAIVIPVGNFWPTVVRGPANGATIECTRLPMEGPLGWWHPVVGVDQWQASRGSGVKVGVIDTGVGPHGDLSHVHSVGAFIDGAFDPAGGADVDSHGSHVCGTIGARPTTGSRYGGVAPAVGLSSARVFPPGEDAGANQGDIASAIDHLSRFVQVDLINMSLGSPSPSQIERDAIIDAFERGTLCICAAGNEAGAVSFPAAFAECVAVSALGLLGAYPLTSLSVTRVPEDSNVFGRDNLFLANFSCFGSEIDTCAPGVGIVATVPSRLGHNDPSGAMDGTSMASPVACGALAAALSKRADYLALERNATRASSAKAIMAEICRDIGLRSVHQGRGVPQTGAAQVAVPPVVALQSSTKSKPGRKERSAPTRRSGQRVGAVKRRVAVKKA